MVAKSFLLLVAALSAGTGAGEQPRLDLFGDSVPEGAVVRLGTVGLRHAGASAVAFSADGRKLTSFGDDRVIRAWDPVTGRQLDAKPLPTVLYSPIAILSQDGKWLGFQDTSDMQAFFLWDVEKHTLRHRLSLQERCWMCPAGFSPDGSTFVTTVKSGAILAWDVQTGKGRIVGRHEREIAGLSFTKDGRLSTISHDQTIRIWSVKENRALVNFKGPAEAFRGALYIDAPISPDGKTVALWCHRDYELSFWDTTTGEIAAGWKPPEKGTSYGRPRFSPDGRHVFLISKTGADVLVWDPIAGKVVRTVPGGAYQNLAFSPDGKSVAATVVNGSAICVWDLATGKGLPASDPDRGHQHSIRAIAFSKDGRTAASATHRDVYLWDAASGRLLLRLAGTMDVPIALTFTADGQHLFVGKLSSVEEFAVSSGNRIRSFSVPKSLYLESMNLLSDGSKLTALCYRFHESSFKYFLMTWDASSGELVQNVELSDRQGSVIADFNADNTWLVTAMGQVLSVKAGKEVARLGVDGWNPVGPLAISKAGALVAMSLGKAGETEKSTPKEFAVQVWEVATLQPVARLQTEEVGHLAFTPDGRRLISVAGNAIQVWNLALEKEVFRRSVPFRSRYGPSFAVCMSLSTDGRKLATGLPDSTALIWDLPAPIQEKVGVLTPEELERFWADLGGTDARRAFLVIGKLTSVPAQVLPLVRDRVKPAKAPAAEEIKQLVKDLEDETFRKREVASKRLDQLGPEADPVLRSVMPAKPSLELERRLEKHFAEVRTIPKEELLYVRTVRLLADIDSADAQELLQVLAGGAAEAWRTRAAQAALKR